MNTNDVNEDSTKSVKTSLDANRDPDVFGVVTAQELGDELFEQFGQGDDISDESRLELNADEEEELLNSEDSNSSAPFNDLLAAVNREPDVFGIVTAPELGDEVSVQPDQDDHILDESSLDFNTDEEEPLNPDGVPSKNFLFNRSVELNKEIFEAIALSIKQEPYDSDDDADTIPVDDINDDREMPEDIHIEDDENREWNDNEDTMDPFDMPAKNFAE